MNKNIYDEPFTYKTLYDVFDVRDMDLPCFNDFKKIRFLYAHDEGEYGADLQLIFTQHDKFFLIKSSHCSCNEHMWDPEEISLDYIQKFYPDIDIEADIFNEEK